MKVLQEEKKYKLYFCGWRCKLDFLFFTELRYPGLQLLWHQYRRTITHLIEVGTCYLAIARTGVNTKMLVFLNLDPFKYVNADHF